MTERHEDDDRIRTVLESYPSVVRATVQREGDGNSSEKPVARVWLRADAWEIPAAWSAQFMRTWRRVYDAAYRTDPPTPAFDTGIWVDSFSGRPIPAAEMEEWTSETVRRVLRLNPAKIVDVGCGSGLLLYRLAPHCIRYLGLDYSQPVVDRLQADIRSRGDTFQHVEVFAQDAEAIAKIPYGSVDLVVLNSVVMYFPSESYLEHILEEATRIVRPGGHIFVGDIRDRRLLSLLCLRIELASVSPHATCADIVASVARRVSLEKQLLVEPAFFSGMLKRHPAISGVKIELKEGAFDNEMNRFRYDATLAIGPRKRDQGSVEMVDGRGLDRASLALLLADRRSRVVRISELPNGWLVADQSAWTRLHRDCDTEWRGLLRTGELAGIRPHDVAALAADAGLQVCLLPSETTELTAFDAVFWPEGRDEPQNVWTYVAAEAQEGVGNGLVPELRLRQERLMLGLLSEHLKLNLPSTIEVPHIVIDRAG